MSFLPSMSSPELARLTRGWRSRGVLLLLVVLPALFGGLLVWANRDVQTSIDALPAAVVNEDEMVTIVDDDGEEQPVMVGRLVAGALTTSDDPENLSWTLTDAETAQAGLRDGSYHAVLTIPAGFSEAALSTEDPATTRAAVMRLETNDATSPFVGVLAQGIASVVSEEIGDELSGQYLDGLYLGLNDVRDAFLEAGDGAEQLADGNREIASGGADLADGATDLADGTDDLVVGIRELAQGAEGLAAGQTELATGLGGLSGGAGDLADGAGTIAGGNRALSEGLAQIADGTADLPGQVGLLAVGAGELAGGAGELAAGAREFEAGIGAAAAPLEEVSGQVGALADGAADLVAGAEELAAGGAQLAPGAAELAAGADELAAGAQEIAAVTTAVGEGTAGLAEGIGDLAAAAGRASEGADEYVGAVDRLAASCAESGAAPEFCAQLDALAEQGPSVTEGSSQLAAGLAETEQVLGTVAGGVEEAGQGFVEFGDGAVAWVQGAQELAAGGAELGAGAGALGAGATPLADGLRQFADGLPELTGGIGELQDGAGQLAAGAEEIATGNAALAGGLQQLAGGVPALADGIAESADASGQLADGSGEVAAGAQELSGGADEAAAGARELADGAGGVAGGIDGVGDGAAELADGTRGVAEGTGELADGASELADGTQDLADGLIEGGQEAPTFGEQDRERLTDVVTEPVVTDTMRLYETPVAAGLAAAFMAIGLWFGALALFVVLRPLPTRAIATTAPSWRVALSGLAPAAVLGALQAFVLVLAIAVWVDIAAPIRLVTLAVLASLAFVAINQALVAALGRRGRIVALAFTAVQLAAAAAVLPIETAPRFFAWLNPLMPMTWSIEGFRALVAGGSPAFVPIVTALLAWILVSVVVSVMAAQSQRSWTPQRLHGRQPV